MEVLTDAIRPPSAITQRSHGARTTRRRETLGERCCIPLQPLYYIYASCLCTSAFTVSLAYGHFDRLGARRNLEIASFSPAEYDKPVKLSVFVLDRRHSSGLTS